MHHGLSYWEVDTWYTDHDYVIIGGGITGLAAALHLRKLHPSARIIVVDRGHLPTGGSTKNAGFLCFGSVGELMANITQYGESETIEIIKRRIEGLRLLRESTADDDIGYQACGGYEVTTSQAELEDLAQHIPYLNQLMKSAFGLDHTFSLTDHQIGNLASTQIFNQYEGSIHTGKLMSTLMSQCQRQQILLLAGTEITTIEESDGKQICMTARGPITSKNVICCTNAFTSKFVSDIDIEPKRNQVIVTKPLQHNLPLSCFHFDQGYVYFRPIGDRILIGGARNQYPATESTDEFQNTQELTDWLRNWTADNLDIPHVEIEMQWSGILGVGRSLHPIIEEIRPNVYIAARMNGMGVAIGSKVAYDVAQLASD